MSDNLGNYLLTTAAKDEWQKTGVKKRAGVLAPLFSVYSRGSVGIGDFADLKLLVDWAVETGNSIIQLLPLNETGSAYCPYDSLSSFALEPAYICLRLLDSYQKESIRKKIEAIKQTFPAGSGRIDYGIKKAKTDLLWSMFIEEGSCENGEFKKFIIDNNYWLLDFSLFKVLKKYLKERAWYDWQACYKDRDASELKTFQGIHNEEVMFQMWVQWQLYRQFRAAKEYAAAKGILINGDLPILVSRDSADVWAHPGFFKLGFAAGAPPDMYCAKGQRWGMPTYEWKAIASDGYRYLKEKLKVAENFYDILRIDHVVGLFRIWSIHYDEPLANQGLNGFFDPWEEGVWKEHGRGLLLEIINSTKLLLCAEDLGVIPKDCTETLKELGIPGNDVQRWVKDWKTRHDFLLPHEYRQLSVAMLSTHDTTNWPAWWENEAGTVDEALFIRKCNERKIDFLQVKDKLFDINLSCHARLRWLNSINSVDVLVHILGKRKEDLADFIDLYKNSYQEKEKLWKVLRIPGPMREKADAEIVRAVLKLTLGSQAIFCIQLITDWLYLADILKGDPYQYRINRPGTISSENWSLAVPLYLEELLNHPVSQQIKELVTASGR